MIVDHLSSSLNLFRIVTIYLWFSNLICFALQVSHTIRTFILYWGGYIYQGYLSDICTHMQTSKHILLCSFQSGALGVLGIDSAQIKFG